MGVTAAPAANEPSAHYAQLALVSGLCTTCLIYSSWQLAAAVESGQSQGVHKPLTKASRAKMLEAHWLHVRAPGHRVLQS